jgi:Ti-type conjugative transfer relaxase TraA
VADKLPWQPKSHFIRHFSKGVAMMQNIRKKLKNILYFLKTKWQGFRLTDGTPLEQRHREDNVRLNLLGTAEEAKACSPHSSRNRLLTVLLLLLSVVMAIVRPCYPIPYFSLSPFTMKGVSAMLSIKKLKLKDIDYYLKMTEKDYYLDSGEPPGQWYCKDARFGLSGIVGESEITNIYRGFSPNGKIKLVKNAGDEKRVCGWDLTFSAPKSVSVAWACSGRKIQHHIEKFQSASTHVGLDYMQEVALILRRGKAGHIHERASMVCSIFEHSTSRDLDPQLHTHALIMNVSFGENGQTYALDSTLLFRQKKAAGALYRVQYAYLLEKHLGIRTKRQKSWFEIDGVPENLSKNLSKRREAILKALADVGIYSAKAAQIATLSTRQQKQFINRSELFEKTRAVAKKFNFGPRQVRSLVNRMHRHLNSPRRAKAAIERAMERITAQQSHFLECDLVRFTAEESMGEGLSAKFIRSKVSRYLSNTREIVQLKPDNNIPRYATREMIRLEKKMMGMVKASKKDRSHVLSAKIVDAVIQKFPTLEPEQKHAVRYLTQKKGSVVCLGGGAGTGKTFVLKIAYTAWTKAGYEAIGVAVAGKAAHGLQLETGMPSETLCKTLAELRDKKRVITPQTIVVVDESGMVGTRDMEELLGYVRKGKGKLVLVGDANQLQPIDAGGPFRAISKDIEGFVMKNNRRQKEQWARDAVLDMLEGLAEKVIQEFDKRGLLTVTENREQAMQSIVKHWKRKGLRSPKDNLIFTSTNQEATTINKMIQSERKRGRQLGVQYITIEDYRVYTGDRVLICKNSRRYDVRNGHLGTVCGMNGIQNTMSIKLDDGKKVCIPIKGYAEIKLGYAVTTHKGQGMTVKNSYILLGGSCQDREMSYVQLSRARDLTKLFIDKFEAGDNNRDIIAQMNRSNQKDLAIDHEIIDSPVVQTQSPTLRR